jgi:hypothetical protein
MAGSGRIGRFLPGVPRTVPVSMRGTVQMITTFGLPAILVASFAAAMPTQAEPLSTPAVAVAPQYDSTHVYVASADFDRFVASLIAAFGGTTSKPVIVTVTPTPSETMSQLVLTPFGTLSVFGFKTPIPYPFGVERTGYLVTDMDAAVIAARTNGADIVVTPFKDPIGRDAIIRWPGGVYMQLYWHTTPPAYEKLQKVPDNRIYVPSESADQFVRDFIGFAHGKIVADDSAAPGLEIGRPSDTYRRIRIESPFGKMTVLVTDGHLPYPYGREITGYDVPDLPATLDKAKAAGAVVLAGPYAVEDRYAAMVQFPGGYVAEIHSIIGK